MPQALCLLRALIRKASAYLEEFLRISSKDLFLGLLWHVHCFDSFEIFSDKIFAGIGAEGISCSVHHAIRAEKEEDAFNQFSLNPFLAKNELELIFCMDRFCAEGASLMSAEFVKKQPVFS